MSSDVIQIVAAYVALAVPITVAITNLGRIALQWLSQRHTISTAQAQQAHQITTHYLDRALDPQVPLAIRHQLLRFLATPDKAGSRLSSWAGSELKRIGAIVEEANKAVSVAEQELNTARTAAQVAAAERKLEEAFRRQKSLLEPPTKPKLSAAALRAGLIEDEKLDGLVMKDADLRGIELAYRQLQGADFSGSNLSRSTFQGCDLRAASYAGANLTKSSFFTADLRGADLRAAQLIESNFLQARLEGADLRDAIIKGSDMRATYDSTTQWPSGVNPDRLGAVQVDAGHETSELSS